MTMTVLEQETMYSVQNMANKLDKIEKEMPTLRDRFAMEAMVVYNNYVDVKVIAKKAYELADAMLEERKNNG